MIYRYPTKHLYVMNSPQAHNVVTFVSYVDFELDMEVETTLKIRNLSTLIKCWKMSVFMLNLGLINMTPFCHIVQSSCILSLFLSQHSDFVVAFGFLNIQFTLVAFTWNKKRFFFSSLFNYWYCYCIHCSSI